MNNNIKVIRSNFISSRERFWTDFFHPIRYDLTISCPEGTLYYIVCNVDGELFFSKVEKIRQNTLKRSVDFDSLDIRIREDFIKSIFPDISKDELSIKLYAVNDTNSD